MSTFVHGEQLERELREAKAEAHQLKLAAEDRGEQRAATFEAGRVAGLAVALEMLRLERERARYQQIARSA